MAHIKPQTVAAIKKLMADVPPHKLERAISEVLVTAEEIGKMERVKSTAQDITFELASIYEEMLQSR